MFSSRRVYRSALVVACASVALVAVVKDGISASSYVQASGNSSACSPGIAASGHVRLESLNEPGSSTVADDSRSKKAAEQPAVIIDPQDKDRVGENRDVEGKLNVEGWPVVAVKADQSGQPWWVQEPVDKMSDGTFVVRCIFGTAKTPPGTRYKICIWVANTKSEASQFKAGDTHTARPPELRKYSKEITVTRE